MSEKNNKTNKKKKTETNIYLYESSVCLKWMNWNLMKGEVEKPDETKQKTEAI